MDSSLRGVDRDNSEGNDNNITEFILATEIPIQELVIPETSDCVFVFVFVRVRVSV